MRGSFYVRLPFVKRTTQQKRSDSRRLFLLSSHFSQGSARGGHLSGIPMSYRYPGRQSTGWQTREAGLGRSVRRVLSELKSRFVPLNGTSSRRCSIRNGPCEFHNVIDHRVHRHSRQLAREFYSLYRIGAE